MKIVAVCGAGIGTSAILQVNAERALAREGLSATVRASDLANVAVHAADAQVILTSPELVDAVRAAIGRNYAELVVIENYFSVDEIAGKLGTAIG